MSNKVHEAIHALAELRASDFDAASVLDLVQLAYWCHRTLAPITVKTLGRLAKSFEARPELLPQAEVPEGSSRG